MSEIDKKTLRERGVGWAFLVQEVITMKVRRKETNAY